MDLKRHESCRERMIHDFSYRHSGNLLAPGHFFVKSRIRLVSESKQTAWHSAFFFAHGLIAFFHVWFGR